MKLIAMAVAILLTACIAVFAAGKAPAAFPPKQFNYQMSIIKIVVASDIDLLLQESKNRTIEVAGNDADVEKVGWKIRGDVLYLKSKKGSLKNKVQVTVDVNQLKELVIEGKSTISSVGSLISPGLYVYMEDDSYVTIKNVGHIYIINGNYTDLDIKKIVGDVQVGK